MVTIDGALVLLAFICGLFGVCALACYCRLSSRRYRRTGNRDTDATSRRTRGESIRESRASSRRARDPARGEELAMTPMTRPGSSQLTMLSRQGIPEDPPPSYEAAITDQWDSRDTSNGSGTYQNSVVHSEDDLPPPYSPTTE